jgi:Zn-dependent M28 family amino/carboxypeptidase
MKAKENRIYNDVKFLSQIDPPRTYANLESLDEAAEYIEEEFLKLECTVENQYFTVNGEEYQNVIASFNTDCKKTLVVGAHYDVCGDIPGADDNASGISGLLECARLLNENKSGIDYRIDFVAYCLEEPPFYKTPEMGSAFHAKSLLSKKKDVMGMICLDMIGYFSENSGLQNLPYQDLENKYSDKGDFIILAGRSDQKTFTEKVRELMQQQCGVKIFTVNDPRLTNLLELSDHVNYWNYGFNALMINDTAMIRNENYHTIHDTIETLDFEKMTEVVNGCYYAIINM